MISNNAKISADLLSQAEAHLFAGELALSEQTLSACEPQEICWQRKKNHLRAKNQFARGNYEQAVTILEETLGSHGSHVLLLADLLLSYYMLNKHLAWVENLPILERNLAKLKNDVSDEHWARAAITCGKFLEELGQVNEAILLYLECCAKTEAGAFWHERALCQLVRCAAFFNETEVLNKYYPLLVQFSLPQAKGFHLSERVHALFMAELSLFGPGEYLGRFEKVREALAGQDEDVRWIFFDMLEMLLLKNCRTSADLLVLAKPFSPDNDYERSLLILLSVGWSNFEKVNTESLAPWERVKVWLLLSPIDSLARARLGQWSLSLSSGSQKIFDRFLKNREKMFGQNSLVLKPDFQIQVQDQILNVDSKKILYRILVQFRNTWEVDLADIIGAIWQTQGQSEGLEDRLRVNVSRVNSLLKSYFSGQNVLQFRDKKLCLNPNVRIL